MVDERSPADPSKNATDDLDDDFGDDWESVFQEEDYAFGEDEDQEYFLEESKEEASAPPSSDSGAKPSGKGAAPPQDHPESSIPEKVSLLARLQRIVPNLVAFRSKKVIFPAALVILLGAGGAVYFFLPADKAVEPPAVAPAVSESMAVDNDALAEIFSALDVSPEKIPAAGEALPVPPPAVVGEDEPMPPGETIRKKWEFPGFMVIPSDDAEAATLFQIDITLIVPLTKGERLPEEQRPFVREIIYQFFQNKKLHELKQFSLSRSQMNRQLKLWFNREWPDNPVSIIVISRYAVI